MVTSVMTEPTATVESPAAEPVAAKHGDLTLLDHPVAQQLLQSTIPARLAYVAPDGTPRVVPMLFHWTGEDVVLSSWPDDPKVAALRARPQVALTIDPTEPLFRGLQIRGAARVTIIDGVPPEMLAANTRYMGPEAGLAWAAQASQLSPQMAQIAIRPAWVDVVDPETRLPSGLTRRLAKLRE